MAHNIIKYYSYFILAYFILVSLVYLLLNILSLRGLRTHLRKVSGDITKTSRFTKPVSILVPAYNEEMTIVESITSLLDLNYPEYEIVVVNDGSKDGTLEKIVSHFRLRKIDVEVNERISCNEIKAVYSSFELNNLLVIDKVNGGKSDALNAGINVSRYPLFCAIDADCVIEKDSLLRLAKPFMIDDDMVAAGGMIRLANGLEIADGRVVKSLLPKKLLEKLQIVEYYRAFLASRVGWGRVNSLLIVSGAFGMFRKSSVIEVGGYKKTIGEDMELTLRLHHHYKRQRNRYKLSFVPDAECFTQAPDSLAGLRTQRMRWQRGLLDSLIKHAGMIFNPRYGFVGLVSLPYFLLFELLGPLIELVGIVMLGLALYIGLVPKVFILLFALAFLYGLSLSLSAILIEQISYGRFKTAKENVVLILCAVLEQVLYRPLTVTWRVFALVSFRKGKKSWGTIKRKSFS